MRDVSNRALVHLGGTMPTGKKSGILRQRVLFRLGLVLVPLVLASFWIRHYITLCECDRPQFLSRTLAVSISIALATVLGAILYLIPKQLVRRDEGARGEQLPPPEYLKAVHDRRVMLLQMIGGTFLAMSAYFTWSQVAISRDGQVTERYSRTIDQLGSKNRSVRLGAIYGLKRIARDSAGDSTTIASILVAYIQPFGLERHPADNQL